MRKLLVVVSAVTLSAGHAVAQSIGEAALRAAEARKNAATPAVTFDMRDIDPAAARAELFGVALDAARWTRLVAADRAVAQAIKADAALLQRYQAAEIPSVRALERFIQRETPMAAALKSAGVEPQEFASAHLATALAVRESTGDAAAIDGLPAAVKGNIAFVKARAREVKALETPFAKLNVRVPTGSAMYSFPSAASAPRPARPASSVRPAATSDAGGELGTGPEVPDFEFVDFNGSRRTLGEFRGKYLMLDFWGSWCPPCRAEVPYVKDAYERFQSRGFEVLGMDYERGASVAQVKAYLQSNGVTWTFAQPDSVRDIIVEGFRVTAFPTVVLLDPNGRIMAQPSATLRGPMLAATLDRILPR